MKTIKTYGKKSKRNIIHVPEESEQRSVICSPNKESPGFSSVINGAELTSEEKIHKLSELETIISKITASEIRQEEVKRGERKTENKENCIMSPKRSSLSPSWLSLSSPFLKSIKNFLFSSKKKSKETKSTMTTIKEVSNN